jgi:polyisoprenoid-binding protein YceI
MRTLWKILLGAVVVLVLAGGALWWFVLRDTSPPPPELEEIETTGRAVEPGALDGTWTLVADDEHYAGYRIGELFGGDTVRRDAVARTNAVEGTLTLTDDQLTAVDVTTDLTALESDDPTAGRRDNYLQTNGLEIETFPEATFTLTEPVDLHPLPAEGVQLTLAIDGELTLHGVTKPVVVTVDARWNGDAIELAGTAPIVLVDFGIEPPDIPGLAKVDTEGKFEVLLRFERGGTPPTSG